ncbi:MAG: hypothetical protein KF718_28085 [Polyangiaceae bacterium]|nr:hypothetical protein [Polyangiaceae bacterium]
MRLAAFFKRSLGLGVMFAVPLLAGAKGGGCSSSEVPIGSDSQPCGSNSCQAGEFCCNESCGICAPKGGACIELVCEPAQDGGGAGVACGSVTCGVGQECCNASCGICVDPGGACIQVECSDACEGQNARAMGQCDMMLGYRWTGETCEPLGGCSCAGSDCPSLFASLEDCQKAYAQCESAGEVCGKNVCTAGQECCNASCGICTEPGGACIELACGDDERVPASGACVKNSNDACSSDADCTSGGCGGELCFNPAVSSGISTCECSAPAVKGCGCVSGQCTWYN